MTPYDGGWKMKRCCFTATGSCLYVAKRIGGEALPLPQRSEECCACLHACPRNALHWKPERSAARFRNEYAALKEIITANE